VTRRTEGIVTALSLSWWRGRLFAPIDIASLAFFRIAFGAILFWEVTRYFAHGWIERYYIRPEFLFHYPGFDWVRPWPGIGMYVHFGVIGLAAVGVVLGLWYRISATVLFLGFTYVFLLEEANYLNHFYLVVLLAFLMIWLPVHRAWSLDARRSTAIRTDTVPAWPLWLLRGQLCVVYFYAGVAKLNADWLRGNPIGSWLQEHVDWPIIGPLFAQPWTGVVFAWAGLCIDLFTPALLLWKRSRPVAIVVLFVFHTMNAHFFAIGIFPILAMASTLLFLEPDWPRRFWVARRAPRAAPPAMLARRPGVVLGFLAVWFAIQLLVPLRHWLYPGPVSWTEEGHCFSWHMKLRDKEGDIEFTVLDSQTQEMWSEDPLEYLTQRQYRKMVTRPKMILKFAHYLEQELRERGHGDVEIHVESWVSLNGRSPQLMIDPIVDLTQVHDSWRHADWILMFSP
jgi:hypothetical protein